MSTPTRESTDSEMSRLYTERDQLQRDLNERDEQLHDLEQRRRDEFDNGQAAERRVDLLEGLLQMFIENTDDRDVIELSQHALKPAEGGSDDAQVLSA